MNVGIIVYSKTGNTLSVAQKIGEALKTGGHAPSIIKVEPANENTGTNMPVQIKAVPDVSLYDAVIFASPVQAFSLAPIMKLCLEQISSLTDKKVYCFVTQHFKKAWMGGNRAVRQIWTACKLKGAEMLLSGVVNWSGTSRDKQIENLVSMFSVI